MIKSHAGRGEHFGKTMQLICFHNKHVHFPLQRTRELIKIPGVAYLPVKVRFKIVTDFTHLNNSWGHEI